MASFTNGKGLPTPVVQLTEKLGNAYSKGDSDISTTELIGEPLQRILKREYAEGIVEDVVDYTHRMIGTVIHNALAEMEGDKDSKTEERLYINVNGWVVSGEPDYYVALRHNTIIDYKYTAKYKTRDGVPEDWKKQISIYAHMLREHGHQVDFTKFCVWYRDAYAKRGDVPVEVVDCEAYPDQSVAEYLLSRVAYHQVSDPQFNSLVDISCVPECSEKARYHNPKKYAFMKTGRKSAIKLHDTREGADKDVADNGGKGYWVQERKATNDFCTDYCIVAKYCQYEQARRRDEEETPDSV